MKSKRTQHGDTPKSSGRPSPAGHSGGRAGGADQNTAHATRGADRGRETRLNFRGDVEYSSLVGRPDHVELRRELSAYLSNANDPRRQHYLQLLSTINGWLAPEDLSPALDWFLDALRVRIPV